MKTEKEFMEMLNEGHTLTGSEYRTFNRYYLSKRGCRLCSNCSVIYDDISENFHIKRYFYTNNIRHVAYSSSCKKCKSRYNLNYRSEIKKDIVKYLKKFVSSIKSRANAIDVPFDLDVEYLLSVLTKQEYKCHYTDRTLDFTLETYSRNYPHREYPSLDRITPSKGYVKGNVVWVLYYINRMKNDLSDDEFIDACSIILKNRNIVNNV